MRLAAKDLTPSVVAAPGTARPVRIRLSGLTYCLEADEAIELATQLADAVTRLRTQETDHHE